MPSITVRLMLTPHPRSHVAGVADIVVPEAGAGGIGQRHAEQGHELVIHLLAESPYTENDAVGNRLFRGNLEMVDLFWMELRARRGR